MSPIQSNYLMSRTISSPSILDASPKKKDEVSLDGFATSISPTSVQITAGKSLIKQELTPVTSNVARSLFVNDKHEQLPSERSMPSGHLLNQKPPKAIPSEDSTRRMLSLRPISPPVFQRETASSSADIRSCLSSRSASPASERCESPLAFTIPIDRSCHSLLTAEYNLRAAYASSPYKSPEKSRMPYQPSRDDDLVHFGVRGESAQSIFLQPRGLPRSDILDESFSFDEETSIPSIRLAHRLSTQESYSTRGSSFSFEEDDDVYQDVTQSEHNDSGKVRCSSCPQPARPSNSIHKSRLLTPEKERQVYEWLHSLELEKDNNDFVAEAASSKFLTGKNYVDGYLMENPSSGIFKTTFHRTEVKPSNDVPKDPIPLIRPVPTPQVRGRSMDNLHGMYSYTAMGISGGARKRPKKTFSLRSSVAM